MLHWIDIAVIVIYLGGMVGMGVYFMRRQKTAKEYLLASKSVGWFAIGLSLLSSLNSAMDYVVGPAQYIEWGLILVVGFVPIILAFPFVLKFFIPFYQRLDIYNCYEFLEYRFHAGVRVVVSLIFILWRICWMGFTIYLPAYVLNVVMGAPLLPTVIVLGAITTTYTTIGGVRAVVWTDVVQAIIMFGGILVAIAILVGHVPGGFVGVWDTVQTHDDGKLLWMTAHIDGWEEAEGFWAKAGLYFRHPLTFWSIMLTFFIGQLNNYGSDHVMIQRYLSARSLADCKRGFITNAIAYMVYITLFGILSFALVAYFNHHPLEPGALKDPSNYEFYFPYFIGFRMPIVLKGLIIAAIYSAAQSSVSAGISASTSVVFANFYLRFFQPQVQVDDSIDEEIERKHMVFNRTCSVCLGVAVTALACGIVVMHRGEHLFAIASRIVSSFSGVMLPTILLGMFSRRATSLGVAVGAICGVVAMGLWGFGQHFGVFEEAMGYGWTGLIGCVTVIVVCYVISMLSKPSSSEQLKWLWKNVMTDGPPAH